MHAHTSFQILKLVMARPDDILLVDDFAPETDAARGDLAPGVGVVDGGGRCVLDLREDRAVDALAPVLVDGGMEETVDGRPRPRGCAQAGDARGGTAVDLAAVGDVPEETRDQLVAARGRPR